MPTTSAVPGYSTGTASVVNITWTASTTSQPLTYEALSVPPRLYWAPPQRERTPEEIAATEERRREQEILRIRQDEQAQEARERRSRAEERARALLLLHLNEEQRAEYEQRGHFSVAVGERQYRIRTGRVGNVDLMEGDRRICGYCIHPRENVPYPDQMLAQKMLLETDEEEFLRIANFS